MRPEERAGRPIRDARAAACEPAGVRVGANALARVASAKMAAPAPSEVDDCAWESLRRAAASMKSGARACVPRARRVEPRLGFRDRSEAREVVVAWALANF